MHDMLAPISNPKRLGLSLSSCLWVLTLGLVGLMGLSGVSFAAEPNDLFHAAAEGDVARVKALLDGGMDPDTANRYGATALTFASDKGHTEVIRLLLERGAEPNVTDTFYNQTPLAWALSKGHFDIAVLLIEHGATGAEANALLTAARTGHAGLAQAVLETWKPYGYQRDVLLELARTNEHEQVAKLLETTEIRELPEIEVPRETLASYTGVYQGQENAKVEVQLDPLKGALVAEVPEAGSLALRPVTETELRAEDRLEIGLEFMGRSGTIEGVLLTRGADMQYFRRVDPEAAEEQETTEDTERAAAKTASGDSAEGKTAPAPPAVAGTPVSSHWPAFRGAGAAGIGSGAPPVTWDVEEGTHVRWKTKIPGLGHSSPIVWGDRIFLTTAISSSGNEEIRTGLTGDVSVIEDDVEHTWKVLAVDHHSGEILWERVAGTAVPQSDRHFKATQANSTAVTDGTHVVAVFPTIGLVCYDVEGNLKWKKNLGPLDAGWFYDPSYGWGFSSSPILFEDLVILQADVQEGGFVAAWRLEDGKQVWRTERDDVPGFSTPNLFETADGTQLVTNGSVIRAYDPRTGKELWRLGPNSELPIATPVMVPGSTEGPEDDLVIVTAGYPPVRPIYAVRPGARGDISLEDGPGGSSEAVAWSANRGGAYMPTPLVYGDLFYLVHPNARMVVYDADTGEEVYKTRFSKGGTFTGSPVAADGRLYIPTEEGQIYVVKAGPQYEELAINDMGEVVMATPAISEGTLFVRSLHHLWALASKKARTGDHAAAGK